MNRPASRSAQGSRTPPARRRQPHAVSTSVAVILCRSGGRDPRRREFEDRVAACLGTAGVPTLRVPHIAHLPETDPLWQRWAALPRPASVVVAWIHPRPAHWILARHGLASTEPDTVFLNFEAFETPEACQAHILERLDHLPGPGGAPAAEWTAETTERWFPVIDADRCNHCGQCMQFCLFDVYARDAHNRITVAQPDRCKPGCPACSRVCPQSAIMFPLYDSDPAIAGAPGRWVEPDPDGARRIRARRDRPVPPEDDGLDALIDTLERLR